jgi:hypothetical protein
MKVLLGIFVVIAVTFGCQSMLPSGLLESSITSTPSVPPRSKEVRLNTLPLVEKWRWSGNINSVSVSRPAIVVTNDRVVIPVWNDAFQRVVVFEAHTGNPIWESEDFGITSIAADERHVYIGLIKWVQAFDLENGRVLWRGAEQPGMERGALVVYPKGSTLEVYDIGEALLYILDVETGQTINIIETPPLFFREDQTDYVIVAGNHYLGAKDSVTGEKHWTHDFGGFLYDWPVFVNEIMVLNAGGRIFAVKAKTGEVLWRTEDARFITGLALQDKVVYAVRDDAAIVGFNPETGEQVGIIEMEPSHTRANDRRATPHYAIAASDEIIAVYYGNSQELIVFERVENPNEDK